MARWVKISASDAGEILDRHPLATLSVYSSFTGSPGDPLSPRPEARYAETVWGLPDGSRPIIRMETAGGETAYFRPEGTAPSDARSLCASCVTDPCPWFAAKNPESLIVTCRAHKTEAS